jgi:uncharacterized membrane protein (DUF4010 family)
MDEIEIFKRLAMALAIGLMLGVERGWETRNVPDGTRIAGIRSYGMMGLLGGLWGLFGQEAGQLAMGLGFVAFASLIVAAHVMLLRSNPGERSIAPVLAAFLSFALGGLAAYGHLIAAAAGGVVTLALLSLKTPLHRFVAWIEPTTMKAAVQLLVISVVLLPVLPNQGYGPEQSLNPFRIWWIVVLIAAIGFVGYIAIKVAGTRLGAMLTAAFGGMASSTVLALSFARMARETPELRSLLAAGVAVASSLMAIRILALAAILNPALLLALAVPMAAMTVVGLAGAGLLWLSARRTNIGSATPVTNPFEFWTAIKLAAFMTVVLLLAAVMHQWYGERGVDLVAAIAGLADVDAITVSMSHSLAGGSMAASAASLAVSIAAIVNTLVKAGVVWVIGGKRMGVQVGIVAVAMSVAAVAGLLIWNWT